MNPRIVPAILALLLPWRFEATDADVQSRPFPAPERGDDLRRTRTSTADRLQVEVDRLKALLTGHDLGLMR
jgi:hypothetical protein